MKTRWITLFIMASICLFGFNTYAQTQPDCASAPPSRLSVGGQGRVIIAGEGLDGLLRVRSNAGINYEPLVDMTTGDIFNIIDEAICVDDILWWHIVTESGVQGWSAEGINESYFVEPLDNLAQNPLPEAPQREIQRVGEGLLRNIVWHPNGDVIAVGTTAGIQFYDANMILTEFLPMDVNLIGWSPNGNYLVVQNDNDLIEVLNYPSLEPTWISTSEASQLSWNANNEQVAIVIQDNRIEIWDVITGEQGITFTPETTSPIVDISWQPNTPLLAIKFRSPADTDIVQIISNDLLFIDTETGQAITDLTFNPSEEFEYFMFMYPPRYEAISWSEDGRYLGIQLPTESILVWDSQTGDSSLQFSYAISDDELYTFEWNPTRPQLAEIYNFGLGVGSMVHLLGDDGDRFYSSETPVLDLTWNPNGEQLAIITRDTIILLDTVSQTDEMLPEIARIEYENTPQAVWNEDETRLVIFDISNCQPTIRDAITNDIVIDFATTTCLQNNGIWSPDGTRIMTILEDVGFIWDLQSGTMLRDFSAGMGDLYNRSYLWSFDSQSVFAVQTDSNQSDVQGILTQLFIWDVNTPGSPTITEINIPIDSLLPYRNTLSPDGNLFLASPTSMQPIYVWDITTNSEVAILNSTVNMFFAVSWLADGSRLATTSLADLSIWDTITWSEIIQLTGHTSTIRALAWSPDGQQIASGDENGRIKIWNVQTGQLLMTLIGHTRNIYNLTWNDSGTQLLSYAWDGTNRVWDVTLP